jgi:hypothetical protein
MLKLKWAAAILCEAHSLRLRPQVTSTHARVWVKHAQMAIMLSLSLSTWAQTSKPDCCQQESHVMMHVPTAAQAQALHTVAKFCGNHEESIPLVGMAAYISAPNQWLLL